MKENNHIVGIVSTAFVILVIAIVWYFLFGYAYIPETLKEKANKVQAEKQLLDISDIDEAYDAVLNKSTKEFIGNHQIDEGFLGWFCSNYGVEALQGIAAYARLDNANIWYETTGSSIHALWYYYCMATGIQSFAYEHTYVKQAASAYETVIRFTGDFSLADGVGTTTYYNSVGKDLTKCIDASLLKQMNDSDIMVINNEFTYTTRGSALFGKDYVFRATPDTAKQLKTMGVDVAGLANNHVYDYGEIGLLDTLNTLQKEEIPYIGAGKDINEASEPIYFITNGKKIAIVAATQIERSTNFTKEATEHSAGVLKTLHPQKYTAAIEKAKRNADYVICFVHWGTEGTNLYGSDQKALAKAFVEAGADAIIGGHTHCLQGVDMIDGVPVCYSLGNFYFSQEAEMPQAYDTAMAEIVIHNDGQLQAKMIPCSFADGRLTPVVQSDEKEKILSLVRSYSDGATLDDEGVIIEK